MEDDARALLISRQQDEFYCLLNKPNNQLQFWVMNSTAAVAWELISKTSSRDFGEPFSHQRRSFDDASYAVELVLTSEYYLLNVWIEDTTHL